MTPRRNSDVDEPTRSVIAGPASAPSLCLLVSTGAGVHVARLRDGVSMLGRGADADIVVDDPSVSREHAEITVKDGIATLRDLGSRNGTTIEGLHVQPRTSSPLRVGSLVGLGSTTLIVQRADAFSAIAEAAPPRSTRANGPIVRDPAMSRLYGLLDLIAPSPLSVLVLGETGSGKEVYAEEVHARSSRAARAFLKLNCAAIPEPLLEAELFGYERGAFSGATQAKPGLLESAGGGTVLLDEVGELALPTQAKLLRALETGEVMRLGSVKSRVADLRVVSATNRDLRELIAEGRFRSDLYFRLNGVSITLPPLRERVLDIEPLATMFADRISLKLKRPPPRITLEARALLEAYPWPGNIRELRNAIERAVVMCRGGELRPEHLMLADDGPPPSARSSAPPPPGSVSPGSRQELKTRLEEMERKAVVEALDACAGNQSAAAKALGITRRALIYRIEQYGLARPRRRD